MAGTGLIMMIGGFGATVVGIPVFSTGAVRKNKIDNVLSGRNNGMSLEMYPTNLFNYQTQTYNPGITLSLRF